MPAKFDCTLYALWYFFFLFCFWQQGTFPKNTHVLLIHSFIMKSAPLGLAGCQEWTEALPVDGVVCLQSKHLRSIAGMIAPPAKIYACDRSRSRWNMKHFWQTARAVAWSHSTTRQHTALHALHLTRTREQRTMHGLVMTGHNARRPRTGRERGRWWRPSEASYLTVWTLNDRFFASPVHCMLRRVLSEYWRKETEKSKVFLWGGRFGRSLLCQGRAEKETRGSWPTTGCLPVDRNQLGPDSWRDKKGVWYRTHRHTHGIKAPWTARSPALARTWHPARINNYVCFSYLFFFFFFWQVTSSIEIIRYVLALHCNHSAFLLLRNFRFHLSCLKQARTLFSCSEIMNRMLLYSMHCEHLQFLHISFPCALTCCTTLAKKVVTGEIFMRLLRSAIMWYHATSMSICTARSRRACTAGRVDVEPKRDIARYRMIEL